MFSAHCGNLRSLWQHNTLKLEFNNLSSQKSLYKDLYFKIQFGNTLDYFWALSLKKTCGIMVAQLAKTLCTGSNWGDDCIWRLTLSLSLSPIRLLWNRSNMLQHIKRNIILLLKWLETPAIPTVPSKRMLRVLFVSMQCASTENNIQ